MSEAVKAEARPDKAPRKKITLSEQAQLIGYLAAQALSLRRTLPADAATVQVYIYRDQIEDLAAVAETLRLFDQHGGKDFIVRQLAASRGGRRGR